MNKFRLSASLLPSIALIALTALAASTASTSLFADPDPTGPRLEVNTSVPRRYELTPQLSVFAPFSFGLQNDRYDVAYADGFTGMPTFQLAAATRIAFVGPFDVFAEAKIGYGNKSNTFQVIPQGQGPMQETLRFHWMPMSVATRWMYHVPSFPYVRPTLTIGGGSILIGQQGTMLPGINRTYLVPFLVASPALTFVDGSKTIDWFGGFVFGTSFYSSFASSQTVRGMSFDLSLNVVL